MLCWAEFVKVDGPDTLHLKKKTKEAKQKVKNNKLCQFEDLKVQVGDEVATRDVMARSRTRDDASKPWFTGAFTEFHAEFRDMCMLFAVLM